MPASSATRPSRSFIALALVAAAASATAATVSDPLSTCGGPDGNSIVFGTPDTPPIPPDFFSPGSDPFFGIVHFTGVELDPLNLGTASLRIQWPFDPVPPLAPPGAQGQVPIEIVALSLVSIDPITVTYNGGVNPQQWDLGITLSPVHPPQGFMNAIKTHPNGGTFDAQLFVQPVFTFAKVEPPYEVRVLDTAEFGVPPIILNIQQAPFVHAVSPDLPVILPGPDSQFVPGIVQPAPSDINSQMLAPFTAFSPGGGVAHTVCPAELKLARCEVVSKLIPATHFTCQVINNPDGTVAIRDEFEVEAEFRANCACCEYRQYLKGEFKRNGKKVPHVLETGVNLDKSVYKEDAFGDPPPQGSNQHYGHRNEGNNPDHDRYSNPAVRGAGCKYYGNDGPGWKTLDPGDTYSTDLHFLGVIIDTCNQESLLPAHTWDVNCSGTAFGPDPDPLLEILIPFSLNGRAAILGIYRYPGNVLTVVGAISNGNGDVPIDAAEVSITVLGLALLSAPGPGALPQTEASGATAQAMYDFNYPPGSPNPVFVTFTYGFQSLSVDVDVSLPCAADLDGDGSVAIVDFLLLLGAWGPCNNCPPACAADLNGDCQVGIVDFLQLLASWGPCP